MNYFPKSTRGDWIAVAVALLASLALALVDLAPHHDPEPGSKERAVVLATDNADLTRLGLLTTGSQNLRLRILSGRFAGEEFPAVNQLRANLELDKQFRPGDTVLAAVRHDAVPGETILNAQDHYRIGYTVLLFGLFAVLLIGFGGVTGIKALLSFVFCAMVIWKLVVPLCLAGYPAIWIAVAAVSLLTAAIIFLVAGFNRKGVAAFTGALLGVLTAAAMAAIFTRLFHINGAVMPYSQALLYSGYESLRLPEIYSGAIILAASGAVMDLGMDVAAGMQEVCDHRPEIGRAALTHSGIRIGQSVVGTMTTTLLLAYSGGYLTLMMAFAAQGVHPIDFINNPYVASETVKTVIGSFGLVLVAPFTALAGGLLLRPGRPR